jgi:hypothetical protein
MPDKAIEVLLDEETFHRRSSSKISQCESQSVFNSARKNPQAFWAKAPRSWNGGSGWRC